MSLTETTQLRECTKGCDVGSVRLSGVFDPLINAQLRLERFRLIGSRLCYTHTLPLGAGVWGHISTACGVFCLMDSDGANFRLELRFETACPGLVPT